MVAKMSKEQAVRKASVDYARKNVKKVFAKSSVEDRTGDFPAFEKKELGMGKLLGKGGFGTVLEIQSFTVSEQNSSTPTKKIKKKPSYEDELETVGMQKKEFIASHCIRDGGDARYAVKYLSPEVVQDTKRYCQGMIDMAIEVRFLSDIEHPNIVKLRATSTVDPYDENFFIAMDRLYDTLEKRLDKWKVRQKRCSGVVGKIGDRKGTKAQSLMEDRLVVAFDLSSALEHLHSRNILYRDIKPENLGFDVRGDIKLFDFGLAKEIHDGIHYGDGTYKLTGYTGSIRYMAPEVALEKPYNQTCDVYSFSLLLWQMLALEKPFAGYLIRDIRARVHNGESRPRIDESWSVPIKLLLKKGWAKDWKDRYQFQQITKILRKEIVKVREGDDSGLEHMRRRSTFVFRQK